MSGDSIVPPIPTGLSNGVYTLWVLHTDDHVDIYGGTVVRIGMPLDQLSDLRVELLVRIATGFLYGPLKAVLHIEHRMNRGVRSIREIDGWMTAI